LAFDSDLLDYGTVSAGIDLYVLQMGSLVTPTRLLRNAEYPAWSPDGSRIAYHAQGNGTWDIYTVRADGTGVIRLTNYPSDNRYPAWSPDGRWIAFSSNRDGQWEVYATLSDGTGPSYRLTYGGGVHPAWGR
jgi:Tol biopolymer transport system component